jgi:hypothetical protein
MSRALNVSATAYDQSGDTFFGRKPRGIRVATHTTTMTNTEAKREALSTWFLEFSVLRAVFPMLDRVVEERPLDFRVTALSVAISLTALVVGVMLKRGQRTWTE